MMLVGALVAGLVVCAALGALTGAALNDLIHRSVGSTWRGRRTVYLTAFTAASLGVGALAILLPLI